MADKDIMDMFYKNFKAHKDEKIVIYGLGEKTRMIIESFPEFNIIGLLDRDETCGERFGKRILSLEEVKMIKPDLIIIVSVSVHVVTIYNRIKAFCQENNIPVYYVDGKRLEISLASKEWVEDSYWNHNKEELQSIIDKYENISFDIFDTLIMRKTLYPKDVFRILEHKASAMGISDINLAASRIEAEQDIIASSPNIYEIYDRLQEKTNICDEAKKKLLELEVEIEKSVLVKRDIMVDVLDYAVEKGKKVNLVSDMYLTKDILKNILSELGITGYENIYVSCEYHSSKCDGLYDIYKAEVKGEKYLHIGDNEYADGEYAKAHNIDVFLIRSAVSIWEKSPYYDLCSKIKGINDRMMVGLFVSGLFNNPFCMSNNKRKLYVSDSYSVGSVFCGAAVIKFVIWLADILSKEGYDELLLCARDGYLIDKLYKFLINRENKYVNNPKGVYFLCSRQACILAGTDSVDKLVWQASLPYFDAPEEMLRSKFGLCDDEITPYNPKEDVVNYIKSHSDIIINKSKIQKKYYNKYLASKDIVPGKKYVMFDLFTSGTCLNLMEGILDTKLKGIFFGVYGEPFNKDMQFYSLIDTQDKTNYSYTYSIYHHYWFFETFMTSFEPSLRMFDMDGNPIFAPEVRDEDYLSYVKDMQEGIWDYADTFIKDLWISTNDISLELVDSIFNCSYDASIEIDCPQINNLYLYEDLGKSKLNVTFGK